MKWSERTKVRRLYGYEKGMIFNTIYADKSSTCNNGARFHVPMEHPNYDCMVRLLEAALMSGEMVTFYFDDSEERCAPAVMRIKLK